MEVINYTRTQNVTILFNVIILQFLGTEFSGNRQFFEENNIKWTRATGKLLSFIFPNNIFLAAVMCQTL